MDQSSRPAAWACYVLAALLAAAAVYAWWSPRASPVPWFAPAILAVVAATFGSTFGDADLQERQMEGLEEGRIETRSGARSAEAEDKLGEQQ